DRDRHDAQDAGVLRRAEPPGCRARLALGVVPAPRRPGYRDGVSAPGERDRLRTSSRLRSHVRGVVARKRPELRHRARSLRSRRGAGVSDGSRAERVQDAVGVGLPRDGSDPGLSARTLSPPRPPDRDRRRSGTSTAAGGGPVSVLGGLLGGDAARPADLTRLRDMAARSRENSPAMAASGPFGVFLGGEELPWQGDGSIIVAGEFDLLNLDELRSATGRVAPQEALAVLYEREGQEAIRRLRGAFSVAVWDSARRLLVLAVDQV